MKKKQVMARLFALCLSTALVGGNTVSALAAVPDKAATEQTAEQTAEKTKEEKAADTTTANAETSDNAAKATDTEKAAEQETKSNEQSTKAAANIFAEVSVDSDKGSVNGNTKIKLEGNAGIFSTTYTATLPSVQANEGYKFTGWKITNTTGSKYEATVSGNTVTAKVDMFAINAGGTITVEAQFAKETTPVKKFVNTNFNAGDNGYFTNDASTPTITKTLLEGESCEIPSITAKEGYKFVGWTVSGKQDSSLDASTTTFVPSELAFFYQGQGNVTLTAKYEEEPVVEKKVNIYFSLNQDQGQFVDNEEASMISYENVTEDSLVLPKVEAKEGYVFTGWKGTGKDEIVLDATAFELGGIKDLANFAGSLDTGLISLEAQFEKIPEAEKTVNVYFSLNTDKGQFKDNPEAETESFQNLTEDKIALPEVEAKEGYVFTGWKGTGKDEIVLDATAFELGGIKDLANFADGSNNGDISLEAQFEEIPEAEKTVNVYFSLNTDKGQFKDNPEAETESFQNLTEDKIALPEVEAKEGYVFTGWKGTGKDEIVLDATAFELGGIKDLANFADGSNNGDISLEAQFEEIPEAEKTVNVYFSLNTDKGQFKDNPEAETESFQNLTEDKIALPEVEAKEGYVFTGWKGTGKDEIVLDATAFELGGIKDLANFADGSNNGDISLEAQFEEIPEAEKTVNVYFSLNTDKGQFKDNPEAETESFQNLTEDKIALPEVEAKEGYVFTGWKGTGKDEIVLDATAFELGGIKDLANFADGSNNGDISLEAQFEEIPEAERTVNVYFNVDSEKGYFTDPEGAEVVSYENLSENTTEQFLVPKVAAKEGYRFVGWKGQGADVIEWDANASTFGVTGLAHFPEGSNQGYATIEAVFEEIPEAERTVNVYFNVDPEKGYFTDPEGAEVVSYENLPENTTEQFLVPKVAAKEGYRFVGWKGQGADVIEWDANASTFGVTGLAHFEDGSNVGNATIEAVFEEIPEAERTVNVYFNVDPEKGYFTDPEGAEVVSYENLPENTTEQFLVPKVAAKEGYVFTGWKGQGAEEILWDANPSTFGIAGLAHFAEGSNVGYASIEAQFEKIPDVLSPASADIVIDLEKGYFEGWEGVDVLENENLQESDYTLGFLPAVKANDGYKWTGWKVTNNAGTELYVLDTVATSIAFPYGIGDHYTVMATFEKVDPENPDPENPDPENPDPENPDPENPDSENPDPEKPNTKPEKPNTKPEKPNTETKKPEKTNGVKTGDTTNAGVFAATLLGSAVVVSGIALKKKSSKKK